VTTALSIINRAAELIGYKDPDETLSGNESNSFLDALNAMVDEWNTKRLYIVASQEIVTTVSGTPISIGTGATINTPRPVRIDDGFVRLNAVDYPIEWLTQEQYNDIRVKAVAGQIPQYGYYEPSLPAGAVFLWPVPQNVSLHLIVATQLDEFADLATSYNLAPGYRKALAYSLAEEIAPGRAPLNPLIANKAASARRAIKTANFESPQLDSGPMLTPYSRFVSGV
jgi:hypothetical protein